MAGLSSMNSGRVNHTFGDEKKSYVKKHLDMKLRPELKYGSIHFYDIVDLSRKAFGNMKGTIMAKFKQGYYEGLDGRKYKTGDKISPIEIIKKVCQRNGWWSYPENLSFCMLFDDRLHVRKQGIFLNDSFLPQFLPF